MLEVIQDILERTNFENKDKVSRCLKDSIKVSKDSNISTYAVHENIHFKTDEFFKGVSRITNDVTKDKRLPLTIELLDITLEELGLEVDIGEVFIIYHLRNLGRFRMKESKLKDELKGMWGMHKEYALNDGEFSYALKSLMRMGIIEYRKGNLSLKPGFIISYKN